MDKRLEQAIEFSNYRQTLNNQIHKLKIRAQAALIISKNGGSFTINRELISFVDYVKSLKKDEVVLLDDNNIPVLIDNISEFLIEITKAYFEITNDYYTEYQVIRKSRNVKSILDIKDE